jgi:hypothetical protein
MAGLLAPRPRVFACIDLAEILSLSVRMNGRRKKSPERILGLGGSAFYLREVGRFLRGSRLRNSTRVCILDLLKPCKDFTNRAYGGQPRNPAPSSIDENLSGSGAPW